MKPFTATNALLSVVEDTARRRVLMHLGAQSDIDPQRFSVHMTPVRPCLNGAEDERGLRLRAHIQAITSDATRAWMRAATRTVIDCSTDVWLSVRCDREQIQIHVDVYAGLGGPSVGIKVAFVHQDDAECKRRHERMTFELADLLIDPLEIEFPWLRAHPHSAWCRQAARELHAHTPICADVIDNIVVQYLGAR